MDKVKTEGVRDNVEHASLALGKLIKSRSELHTEIRAKVGAANRESSSGNGKISDRVEALENKVLGSSTKCHES